MILLDNCKTWNVKYCVFSSQQSKWKQSKAIWGKGKKFKIPSHSGNFNNWSYIFKAIRNLDGGIIYIFTDIW